MKKTIFLLLMMMALLLSACAKGQESCPAEEEPSVSVPAELPIPMLADGAETVPEEADAPTEPEKEEDREEAVPLDPTCVELPLLGDVPPTLFVVANEETFRFQSGNYSWTSPVQPDGTQTSVIACGIHPLDAEPTDENFILLEPEGTMEFWFYVEPKTVTCRCWEERFWGKPEEGEPSCYALEIDNNTITPLGNERYVYELDADWGDGCSASYIFFAMRDAIPSEE